MLPPWRGKSYGCDCRTSEGARPTKGEEPTLTQIKAASDLLMPNKSYMSSDAFGRVVMAVASALAAQEARHKAAMEVSERRRESEVERADYVIRQAQALERRLSEAESKLREATETLRHIATAYEGECGCSDHASPTCCNAVEEPCAFCLSRKTLAAIRSGGEGIPK